MQRSQRDEQAIERIAQLRVVPEPLLVRLFPSNPHLVATNKSEGVATGQYLTRHRMPFLQREGYIHILAGEPRLYTLADRGAKFLRAKGITFYGAGYTSDRKRINGRKAWEKHAQAIAEGRAAKGQTEHLLFRAEAQIKFREAHPIILDWLYDGEAIHKFRRAGGGAGVDAKVIPDDEVHLPPYITHTGRPKPHIVHLEADLNLKDRKSATDKMERQYYLWRTPKMMGTWLQFLYVLKTERECEIMRSWWKQCIKKVHHEPDAKLMNFVTLANLSFPAILKK